MSMEGLLDFGQGLTSGTLGGATVGAKIGGPKGAAIGAGIGALMAPLSYFGGQNERRMVNRANKQSLELGDLEISETRRKIAMDKEQQRRKQEFGKLLAQYFQRGAR